MAKYVVDSSTMTEIANPLRELTGRTDDLTPAEMAAAGAAANSEVQTQTDLIAQIGAALQGKAGSGEGIVPTGTKQITENGTYDVAAYASAEVNVRAGRTETWTFELTDGSTQTKEVVVDI